MLVVLVIQNVEERELFGLVRLGGVRGRGGGGEERREGVEQRLGSEGREGLFFLYFVLIGKRNIKLGVFICLFFFRFYVVSFLEVSFFGFIFIR